MPHRLHIVSGPERGQIFPLVANGFLLVGRADVCEICLSDPGCARVHALVQFFADQATLWDHRSEPGTLVNGQRVLGHSVLQADDVIRIGETDLRYAVADDPEPAAATPSEPEFALQGSPQEADTRALGLVGASFNHFAIGLMLAQERTGLVFRAWDGRKKRDVALRVLWPSLAQGEANRQAFFDELRALLPLHHPNLVTVYEAGRKGPYCWAATEYVEGPNLREVLRRQVPSNRLAWEQVFRIAVHAARALRFLHQHGILCRGLTPQQIVVRERDQVVKLAPTLIGEAFAHLEDRPEDLPFLAPERAQDRSLGDEQSDIYCLGAVLYTLLTGIPPFEGVSAQDTTRRVQQEDLRTPQSYQATIPDGFQEMLMTMLARQPNRRYRSITEVLAALQRVTE